MPFNSDIAQFPKLRCYVAIIILDMFLISKIVRGRRLLHELEAETEKKQSQEVAVTEPITVRQNAQAARPEKFMGEMSQV